MLTFTGRRTWVLVNSTTSWCNVMFLEITIKLKDFKFKGESFNFKFDFYEIFKVICWWNLKSFHWRFSLVNYELQATENRRALKKFSSFGMRGQIGSPACVSHARCRWSVWWERSTNSFISMCCILYRGGVPSIQYMISCPEGYGNIEFANLRTFLWFLTHVMLDLKK